MPEATLAIIGIAVVAVVFGYLWFRRMRLSVSDTYNPTDEGNEK